MVMQEALFGDCEHKLQQIAELQEKFAAAELDAAELQVI